MLSSRREVSGGKNDLQTTGELALSMYWPYHSGAENSTKRQRQEVLGTLRLREILGALCKHCKPLRNGDIKAIDTEALLDTVIGKVDKLRLQSGCKASEMNKHHVCTY